MIFFTLFTVIFMVGIAAAVIYAQWQLIKHKTKWKWVLPVVVTILAVLSTIQMSWMSHSSSGTTSVQVWDEGEYIGEVQTAIDRQKHIYAIGRLVIGDTEKDLEYVDLEYKDGELVGSEEALKYRKEIDEAIGFATKNFTGSTVSLEEVKKAQDKIKEPVKTFSFKNFIRVLAFYAICPLILWIMVLGNKLQSPKGKQLDKTRIEDL